MNLLKKFAPLLPITAAALAMWLAPAQQARAQAEAAGIGPGTYLQAGATFSAFQMDYGQRKLGGAAVFVDAHLYRRIGAEAEVRFLDLNESEQVHDTTFLVGPKYSVLPGRFRPYGKFLVGRGEFYFPFHYAKGSYFVMSPGFGMDLHLRASRMSIRLFDVEFQNWPGFTFGQIKPYGLSSGVAIRLY